MLSARVTSRNLSLHIKAYPNIFYNIYQCLDREIQDVSVNMKVLPTIYCMLSLETLESRFYFSVM